MTRFWDWYFNLPTFFQTVAFITCVLAGACAIVTPIAYFAEQAKNERCDAVHGHPYYVGRDTLCLTSDNRVITNW